MKNNRWPGFLALAVLLGALAVVSGRMVGETGRRTGFPRETFEDFTEKTSGETFEDFPEEISRETFEDFPEETSEETTEAFPEELPAAYDGRQTGRAPKIKNQGSLGTCWAFASLMALEARLLPGETEEFSADHMSLGNGFCIPQEEGGEYTMSMAYLLSWKGPVREADDPYGDGVTPEGLKAVKHVQEIQMIPGKDYEKIKRAILEYGGVQSSLYTSMTDGGSPSEYYDSEEHTYCYIGSNPPNHDSVIIGWDDHFPKEKFRGDVLGDGAFLCTNSWGDDFGDQGYFYVSYYDSNIGLNNIAYTVVEDADNYSHIYQSDLRGWVGQLGYGEETAWFSNVYQAAGAERIDAVGFYATDRHSSYEVYLVRDVGSGEMITAGQGLADRKPAAKGSLDYTGYYTIPLDRLSEETRDLKPGERFAVIVKLTTPGAVHPVAVEYDAEDGKTTVDISDGEGYISMDGIHWSRVEEEQACNLCLKAYTTDRNRRVEE